MTATEAIASMREDIARLEAKNLGLKPGFFARRRAEVDAIERELASLQAMVDRAEFAEADTLRQAKESDLRTGILANVLQILGFSPWRHLRAPIEHADDYARAAAMVMEQAKAAGRSAYGRRLTATHGELGVLLTDALHWARIDRLLQPFQHLSAPDATIKEKEHANA